MFDAHVRAWKTHLEREQMATLLRARWRVNAEWERKLSGVSRRIEGYRDRPWRT